MEKDDWYRNRILWRANQHKLFDKQCCKFSELSKGKKLLIEEKIPKDVDPVIVFWGDLDTWTVLGTKSVCSFYNGKLSVSNLDKINRKISIYHSSDVSSDDIKNKSNRLYIEFSGQVVWVPSSSELFALMSILLMFPLKMKNEK